MGICSILLSLMVNNVFLKHLVARSRPFDVIAALHPLISKPTDYSFPSGHTACSFAVGFLLFRKLPKKFGIPCLLLAILIGFSRIYVGVHYPSDVIAGAVSGRSDSRYHLTFPHFLSRRDANEGAVSVYGDESSFMLYHDVIPVSTAPAVRSVGHDHPSVSSR